MKLDSGDASSIGKAEVEVVGQHGSEIVLETRADNFPMTVARVEPHLRPAMGDVVQLSVMGDQLHFFDPQTEGVIR